MTILNAMTVDVEEHFQVSAFESTVSRDDWQGTPSRVEANTGRILDLLDEVGAVATFFVLGWIAQRHPGLVRRISERGHEIGSHGESHRLVYEQSPAEFRQETMRSRSVLQDESGQPVLGYRAASFSIGRKNLWALDVLAEAGFEYDSSIFPVVHDRYGMPGAPRSIHELRTPTGETIDEVPPSCIEWRGTTLPVCGGGYLRLYPLAVTRWAIKRLNRRDRMPAIVYVHPWEVDPTQPRIRAPLRSRFRHYVGLRTTEPKLRSLLSQFRFGPMREVLDEQKTSNGIPQHLVTASQQT